MPDAQTFILILPELILAVFGMLILIADLIWREKGHGALGWFTLLGFVLAFAATLSIWGSNARSLRTCTSLTVLALFQTPRDDYRHPHRARFD